MTPRYSSSATTRRRGQSGVTLPPGRLAGRATLRVCLMAEWWTDRNSGDVPPRPADPRRRRRLLRVRAGSACSISWCAAGHAPVAAHRHRPGRSARFRAAGLAGHRARCLPRHVAISPTVLAVLGIIAGNTLAPICAYLMLRRVGFRPELDRLRDALALVFLGALGGMLISATVGSCALVLSGALAAGDFWSAWSAWWAGDAMGVLVVTPFLLVLREARWPRGWRPAGGPRRRPCCSAPLTPRSWRRRGSSASLLFLVFPVPDLGGGPLPACRRRAVCTAGVSMLAIPAAGRRDGPFAQRPLHEHGQAPGPQRSRGPDRAAAGGARHRAEPHPRRDQAACGRLTDMWWTGRPTPVTDQWETSDDPDNPGGHPERSAVAPVPFRSGRSPGGWS